MVLVYDGSDKATLYLDGKRELVASRRYETTGAGKAFLSLDMPNHHFVGALDEFMVFDRALSADEVESLYRSSQ